MESRGDEKEARGGGTAAIEKDIQAYRETQMRGVDRVEVWGKERKLEVKHIVGEGRRRESELW